MPRKTRAEQIALGKHMCHWPTCSNPCPPKMWGCAFHWFKLPKILRDKIWATYVEGQEIRKDPSEEYLVAAEEVERWIKTEIESGRQK